MNGTSRRSFLADVGRGMLTVSLGSATAAELGLSRGHAAEREDRLSFGKLEPLVSLMQEIPPDKLLPLAVERLRAGESLKTLVTAGALANARAFGGQDYTGYHTFMALAPAFQMAGELPARRRALPVLKVLYRNSSRIQQQGAQRKDVLHPVRQAGEIAGEQDGIALRAAVREVDWEGAERRFAALAEEPVGEAFNHLQFTVQDEVNVHRVVLAWRAWAMLQLADGRYAHSLLRQSVRFCLADEQAMQERQRQPSEIRELLPRLLEEHRLLERPPGRRVAEDRWVEHLANTIFSGSRRQAAEAVAAALAEGMRAEDVGEAISVAANLLVLHDPGRRPEHSSDQKPPGCVHGDSVGVHASDAANAWRNIARVSNDRNRVASLIVGAFHTAGQSPWVTSEPFPYAQQLEELRDESSDVLLAQLDEAIRANDQARACAVAQRYGDRQLAPRPLLDVLLQYAVSEDGALHAEKFYRTVREEFTTTRPALRWRQLIALARVTASEYGYPAPGYDEACELLKVS